MPELLFALLKHTEMSKITDSLFAPTSYLAASLQKIIRLIEYYTETDGLEGCIFTFGKHDSYQI